MFLQAEKFRSKAQKSDTWRVAGQYCRYLFYLGTIRAMQLEYTEAKEVLQQASRKAPTAAHGFRVACNKWLILVSTGHAHPGSEVLCHVGITLLHTPI